MKVSTNSRRADQLRARRMVLTLEADRLWDQMSAKDVPQEIVGYVSEMIRDKKTPEEIRSALGIASANDAAWKKIVSAFSAGHRINAPVLVSQMLERHLWMSKQLEDQIIEALENGVEVVVGNPKDGYERIKKKGPDVSLTATVTAWSKLQESFIKMATQAGLMRDPLAAKSGPQGTTIVVQSNIRMPTADEIRAHQEQVQKRLQAPGETIVEPDAS